MKIFPKGIWADWETVVDRIARDERQVIIETLKPSVVYQFRMLAVNEFGPGIPSIPSNNITMPQQRMQKKIFQPFKKKFS